MKVLVISSHTDDAELSIGATIHKHCLVDRVKHVCLSTAEISNKEFNTKFEWHNSQNILGIQEKELMDFNTRYFWEEQAYITQYFYNLNKQFKPDLVYTHCSFDLHQDHEITHKACMRVFKTCDVYGYPLSWNQNKSQLQGLSIVNETNLKAKIDSLDCYKSQYSKPYFDKRYIEAQAISDGIKVNRYGEKVQILNKLL